MTDYSNIVLYKDLISVVDIFSINICKDYELIHKSIHVRHIHFIYRPPARKVTVLDKSKFHRGDIRKFA